MKLEYLLFWISGFLLLSVTLNKLSSLLRLPALLIFLFIGMLAGSEGIGGIYFDDHELTQSVGVVALIFILFSGALDTDWQIVRPVVLSGLALSTLGVLFTALLVGVFSYYLLNFSFLEGMLLGSIVSSTDAAAVFSILRSRKIVLKSHLKALLELESGSNDPMAVALTIGFITQLTMPSVSIPLSIALFLLQLFLGVVVGLLTGYSIPWIINRINLEYKGLYPVLTVGYVMLIYAFTSSIGGNGFLAIYIVGLIVGNKEFLHKSDLCNFHDGIAWLMQITMFITLGLLVFPSQLIIIAGVGILISLFLMFIARPLSIFAILPFGGFTFRETTMVSWVGLRGAVPIILATFPLMAELDKAQMIFNIVFFIVITSVLIQGTSLSYLAKWLKVER